MYKNSKWAKEILNLQCEDGSWGYFHSLSEPDKYPVTTEQALRRLLTLGYDNSDEAIMKAVAYMKNCLSGRMRIPDRREKTLDWDLFTQLILSTWIRKFTLADENANKVAGQWAEIVTRAFSQGAYDHNRYVTAFSEIMKQKPYGARLVDLVSFYPISLLAGTLDEKTERHMMDYVLQHKNGIYYIYGETISKIPSVFHSKEASRYLGAIELLADYKYSLDKLSFVVEWLDANRNEDGRWDMGSKVNDKVYFPLSDDWRRKSNREADCTYRIQNLIDRLSRAQ